MSKVAAEVTSNKAVTKILVFMVENHSLDQMSTQMPFTRTLAHRFGYATGYHAITHPSLPNYLAITSGSTHGIQDDAPPASHAVAGPSVFGQALALGRSAKLYAEGMPRNCSTVDGGSDYAVRHNPWTYHREERAACHRYDVPMTQMASDVAAGRLPNAGMVIPDLCHDAHDCTLESADRWLRHEVTQVMSGPDWKSGRLVLVITADEDEHNQDNRVLTVVAHPSLHRRVVDRSLTHYSVSKAYSQILGAAPLAAAATAPSLLNAFGIEPGH